MNHLLSQVLEWLQEENLRSYGPIFVHHRLDSLSYVSWLDKAAVVWIGCQLARIGCQLVRIGRQLARIGCPLARIGRRLEENLRSSSLFIHHNIDSLNYVRPGFL